MKKNKAILAIAISMIAISPFLIFKASFILGLLILVTGILAIVACKKESKKLILIPSIVTISIILISFLLSLFSRFITMLALKEWFMNDMSLLVSLIDEIVYDSAEVLYLFDDPIGIMYMSYAFNGLTNKCTLVLLLPLLLLIGNVVFEKRIGKIITSSILAVLSIYAISVIYEYFFLAAYANVFILAEDEIPNGFEIIMYIFEGYDFDEILSYILTNSLIGSIKWLCLLPMIVSFITLGLSITSISCGSKKHKCHHHEKEENVDTKEVEA